MASAVLVVGVAALPDDADAGWEDDSDGGVVVATFFVVRLSSSSSPVPRRRESSATLLRVRSSPRTALDLGAKKDVIITIMCYTPREYWRRWSYRCVSVVLILGIGIVLLTCLGSVRTVLM
jgi:hypothetical protein